ncbi:hypothetical protein A3A21_00230 [Candidatus Jorgensenbacteria bacterium RIFCSPLOWO2_01_FULL_45_25b]|uniref:Phosphoribosylformylglycinamidine cyclo-ligase n=1 Tax=Candidatus Jorgensenbacteria bacterium RIFCSPLOWO2_01_FULL_45_25b TaxID=1798471 RepID=A0A1F6BS11_9BACT|nr:MAG: hypothetical protein A3A21_00230 [Candidatus Jorgensenbacteria bacterium RIFCSPLOWO2_01_FULL_45_25b]
MYKPFKPYKQKIINEIKKTWQTPYVSVTFNTYPIIQKKVSYPEVDHTDGIGTKGFYHWKEGTFKAAVIDALAMNLNDLAIIRAIPYKLSNHITVPLENERIFKIIQELVRQCLKYKIAIAGGENSFHNNTEGLDISMTVSGFVKNPKPNKFQIGDILIGLKSSGLHSNGFTAIRKMFGNIKRHEFTTPTAIYLDTILSLSSKHQINGLMHITGGAFTKLKDILGKANANIEHPKSLLPQKIFYEIHKKGMANKDMYQTFNCGIGFIFSTPKKEVSAILSKTKNATVIGEITPGTGTVKIKSAFDGKTITF